MIEKAMADMREIPYEVTAKCWLMYAHLRLTDVPVMLSNTPLTGHCA